MAAVDGGTIVGAGALVVSGLTLWLNRRSESRRARHEETAREVERTGTASEAANRLIDQLQDERNQARTDLQQKRDEYHACRQRNVLWSYWAQMVAHRVDLPDDLRAHLERLLKGENP